MADVNDGIQEVLRLRVEATSITSKGQSLFAAANEKIRELCGRIRNGETTGDKVKDFVVASVGPYQEAEDMLHGLEKRVREHQGKFVLMVHRDESFHGCTGFGHEPEPREYSLDEEVCLAVIRGDSLSIALSEDKCSCEIPTGNFAICHNVHRESASLVGRNLPRYLGDVAFWLLLDKPLEIKNPFTAGMAEIEKRPILQLEIKIGDDEVTAWFKERRLDVLLRKMANLLGRPVAESPEAAA